MTQILTPVAVPVLEPTALPVYTPDSPAPLILSNAHPAPARWMILLAFATVFTVWGSSYLGIRFAVETMPPFFMGAVRFTAAGILLIGWSLARGAALPTRAEWGAATMVGFLLFVLNNGLLVWAQSQGLPSGMAALLIATTPFWFVALGAARWRLGMAGGEKPTWRIALGILVGFVGIGLLINPESAAGAYSPLLAIAVVIAALCWSLGSLVARSAPQPPSSLLATGMQLLLGGLMMCVVTVITGETAALDLRTITPRSWLAMIYLALVSSILAYSAFIWLLRHVDTARVSTYAYVNPVIAVILGWALAGEDLTVRTVVAAAIIVASVVIIVTRRKARV